MNGLGKNYSEQVNLITAILSCTKCIKSMFSVDTISSLGRM